MLFFYKTRKDKEKNTINLLIIGYLWHFPFSQLSGSLRTHIPFSKSDKQTECRILLIINQLSQRTLLWNTPFFANVLSSIQNCRFWEGITYYLLFHSKHEMLIINKVCIKHFFAREYSPFRHVRLKIIAFSGNIVSNFLRLLQYDLRKSHFLFPEFLVPVQPL